MSVCCPKHYSVLTPEAQEYVEALLIPEDAQLAEIRQRSIKSGLPDISISPFDARHLEIISRIANPKKIVEVGTLAGYSTIALSRGLVDKGIIYTLENNPVHALQASETFSKHSPNKLIKLIEGDAKDSLHSIQSNGKFDLMFIDANKEAYSQYLDWATENIRIGGLLIADNVFRKVHGRPYAEDIHKFNVEISQSPNWFGTYLPAEDGIAVFIRVDKG